MDRREVRPTLKLDQEYKILDSRKVHGPSLGYSTELVCGPPDNFPEPSIEKGQRSHIPESSIGKGAERPIEQLTRIMQLGRGQWTTRAFDQT
jgi:hypothetical protein